MASIRVLLISQWPHVRNGEFELIEKIKQTGYKIRVVDFFGFDTETHQCLDVATLSSDYDFAISFHYDTPKFLNIPTFLWVANPLEFFHLRGDYRSLLLHHLRAYDDYLYNGSDLLKRHIRRILGSEWKESHLEMFPSCSRHQLVAPQLSDGVETETSDKIFYCGVNWERGIDRAGRAQGLLDILQDQDAADFYGPTTLEGIRPWDGFVSYKGEIPFDGVSMSCVMRQYAAVLAVSSPAHMKSETSSSRVFEGIAAGVPVISDENPHVRKLFGDLVFYFSGANEKERAQSILAALKEIKAKPIETHARVLRAQALMAERFCFEPCFERVLKYLEERTVSCATFAPCQSLDVFLLHHDADSDAAGIPSEFPNIQYTIESAGHVAKVQNVHVRIIICGGEFVPQSTLPHNVSITTLKPCALTTKEWSRLRLGEKVCMLVTETQADYVTFLTQFDYPTYNAFSVALDWFRALPDECTAGVHIGGFYVNDQAQLAPLSSAGIVRNNSPVHLYRWSQDSLAEHQFSTLFFNSKSLHLLTEDQVDRFDVLLPISVIATALSQRLAIHRSRQILYRVKFGHFHRHYEAYRRAVDRGFWAQHYELVTNYNHELNALYDLQLDRVTVNDVVDRVSGHALFTTAPIDPAVHAVNEFINRLRPMYRVYTRLLGAVSFGAKK